MIVKEKRMKYRKDRTLNRLIKFFLLCIIIFCIAIFNVIFCRLDQVIIEGGTHYSEEELKNKIITTKTDKNTILLYLRYRYGEVDSIPFVQKVDLEILDKNTIQINVYDKLIIGCLEYMGGYLYFDKDGMVVESSNEKLENIPLVTGIEFSHFVLYEKLEVENLDLFYFVLNLTQLIQKYELNIDRIQFYENYEVALYSEDIQILLGKRDVYDEPLAELKNILPKAEGKKIVIDMKNFNEGQDKIIAAPKE